MEATVNASAFFLPDGDRFVPTEHTRGPWSAEHQHGGPPAALLAREMERCPTHGDGMQVVRLTVEFLRPVPLAPLTVGAEVIRDGKKVQWLAGWVRAGEKEVCRATALRMHATEVPLPARASRPAPPRPPAGSDSFVFPFFREQIGYHTAMEVRIARGTFGCGAMAAWMRMRHPLLPDEPPSPLQRVAIAADSGNGVSAALDTARYTFINPDLTVHLHRPPGGEWVCLDAATTLDEQGIGLAVCTLHDEGGAIGRSVQSLLIAPR